MVDIKYNKLCERPAHRNGWFHKIADGYSVEYYYGKYLVMKNGVNLGEFETEDEAIRYINKAMSGEQYATDEELDEFYYELYGKFREVVQYYERLGIYISKEQARDVINRIVNSNWFKY
jgi:hypothetical protein